MGRAGEGQIPECLRSDGNTVNDEVLISEDEKFGITLADTRYRQEAVDLYIQIEDENGN